jgi:hypothetical protein
VVVYIETNLFIQVDRPHNLLTVGTRKTPEVILVKLPRRAGNEWNQIQTLITKSKKISDTPKTRAGEAPARWYYTYILFPAAMYGP